MAIITYAKHEEIKSRAALAFKEFAKYKLLKLEYYKAIIQSGGPISIQTSPEKGAEEIRRLLDNPSLAKEISLRGISYATKFTWQEIVRMYLKVWDLSI